MCPHRSTTSFTHTRTRTHTQAIKCYDAVLELGVDDPCTTALTRLAAARVLMGGTANAADARAHLERAVSVEGGRGRDCVCVWKTLTNFPHPPTPSAWPSPPSPAPTTSSAPSWPTCPTCRRPAVTPEARLRRVLMVSLPRARGSRRAHRGRHVSSSLGRPLCHQCGGRLSRRRRRGRHAGRGGGSVCGRRRGHDRSARARTRRGGRPLGRCAGRGGPRAGRPARPETGAARGWWWWWWRRPSRCYGRCSRSRARAHAACAPVPCCQLPRRRPGTQHQC